MQIKTLIIQNFRNIKNKTYNFGKVNCIEAKNHTGKTNSIQALYWLFTGKLLDGSQNDISIKPIGSNSEKVSVKVVFLNDSGEEHSIEKTYTEHWTTTRGSNDLVLTGHDTTFYIDDIAQKRVSDAKQEILDTTHIDSELTSNLKDFDLFQAVMNPTYLGEILDWKVLRKLIVSIIGDVSNEEVMSNNTECLIAKELLERYDYKVDKVVTYCNQQLDTLKKQEIETQAKIEVLRNAEDVPTEELKEIETKIFEKQTTIKELENPTKAVDPRVEALEKEITSLKADYSNKRNAEYNLYLENKNNSYKQRNAAEQEVRNKHLELDKARNLEMQKVSERNNADNKVDALKTKLNNYIEERSRFAKEFVSESKKVYSSTVDQITCPNCGAVLNADAIESAKAFWQKEHQERLEEIKTKGLEAKLNIEQTELSLKEAQAFLDKVSKEYEEVENQVSEAEKIYLNAKQDFASKYGEEQPFTIYLESKELGELKKEISEKETELESIKNSVNNVEKKFDEIFKLKEEIKLLQARQGVHAIYENNQKTATSLEVQLDNIRSEKGNLSMVKEAARLFNKTKLEILNAKLKAHFGTDVTWILAEDNIKEGSWNEVCYPLIIGTNTPYKNGSTSEKVMTGIKVIEIIKKSLNIPDAPILVDEIGELDSESIKSITSFSNSQIIATRVNDRYDTPFLFEL